MRERRRPTSPWCSGTSSTRRRSRATCCASRSPGTRCSPSSAPAAGCRPGRAGRRRLDRRLPALPHPPAALRRCQRLRAGRALRQRRPRRRAAPGRPRARRRAAAAWALAASTQPGVARCRSPRDDRVVEVLVRPDARPSPASPRSSPGCAPPAPRAPSPGDPLSLLVRPPARRADEPDRCGALRGAARDVLGREVGPGGAEEDRDVDGLQQRCRGRCRGRRPARGRSRRTPASTASAGRAAPSSAASSPTSTPLVMSTAIAPSEAASGLSVTVDRNSATAATPSMDQPTYRIASTVRVVACRVVRSGPDSDGHRRLAAEQLGADDVRADRDGGHREHAERDHRDQLGDQQPGAADRADQQVAQRARPAPPPRRRRRRSARPRPAGTAAARSPAPPPGTARRSAAPPTGTPGRCPAAARRRWS